MNEYATAVLCYITTCVENITTTSRIKIPSNRKLWMTQGPTKKAQHSLQIWEQNTITQHYEELQREKRTSDWEKLLQEKKEGHLTNKDLT